ncbi:MAG: tRNA glutamyl-Q(34) synthetase GluQRS [Muribaculaceae bacterium]|nr:tRNA glutamyl-Q(34) synthetase GluQRS [Muribaculaceae bacterium]
MTTAVHKGRFAPSPTGRMHLGNVASALVSWLSVKSRGGKWLLRIEDLDPDRSRREHSLIIEDDLRWLGLEWDEGGTDGIGYLGPYSQSERGQIYSEALSKIEAAGLTYKCTCTRAEIMASQAPHESDGRVVYAGTCRPQRLGGSLPNEDERRHGVTRLVVPDREIRFCDKLYGNQSVNLASHCGDFALRRADGVWAYQLAVVIDDALMGVTEVVRGSDLLLSSAQQIYLFGLLGYPAPEFGHVPLICNSRGIRLSKRDQSMSMGELRKQYKPEEIIGMLAGTLGLTSTEKPISAAELATQFSWASMKPGAKIRLEI